jgi:hypothetical protein
MMAVTRYRPKMTTAKLRRITQAINGAYDIYSDNDDIEGVGHDVAHGILLWGRLPLGLSNRIERRCNSMPAEAANQHEIETCALSMAGLDALGFRIDALTVSDTSFGSLRLRRGLELMTVDQFIEAIQTTKPTKRDLHRFVGFYRAFGKLIA